MDHPNKDFIKKFFHIPGKKTEEDKKLEKKKQLDEYYSRAKNSKVLNEEAKNNISSSMNNIFKKKEKKAQPSKPAEWTTHVTPYGIFHHNKEDKVWMNSFGMMSASLEGLVGAASFADPSLDYRKSMFAPQSIRITTSLVNSTIPNNVLNLAVPTLISNDIQYGHVIYQNDLGNDTDWLNSECCGFNNAVFSSRLQSYFNTYQSNSRASAYNSYFKDTPEFITLNFTYTAGGDEIAAGIPMDSDLTIVDGTPYKVMNLAIQMINSVKQIVPQSKLGHYNVPVAAFYFLPIPGDSCTWAYKPVSVTQQTYEAEQTRLLGLFQKEVEAIAPYSDVIIPSNYALYSEYHLQNSYAFLDPSCVAYTTINSKIYDYANGKDVCTFVCPMVFPGSEYSLNGLRQGNYSLPEAQLKANTEALPKLIYSKAYMERIILNPIKQSGIKSIHLWSTWDYWWTVAALPLTHSTTYGITDADIYLYRKFINDLFADTGIGAQIALDNQSVWQNSSTRAIVMQAALAKDLEMATSFRNL